MKRIENLVAQKRLLEAKVKDLQVQIKQIDERIISLEEVEKAQAALNS